MNMLNSKIELRNEFLVVEMTNGEKISGFWTQTRSVEGEEFVKISSPRESTWIMSGNIREMKKGFSLENARKRSEAYGLIRQGSYSKACMELEGLLKTASFPKYDILVNLSACYAMLEAMHRCEDLLVQAWTENPLAPEALNNLGRLHELKGDNPDRLMLYYDGASVGRVETDQNIPTPPDYSDDFLISESDLVEEVFLPFVNFGNNPQREAGALRLNYVKSNRVQSALVESLGKSLRKKESFRYTAFALGNFGSELALDPLVDALVSHEVSNTASGRAAAIAIGKIGNPMAIPFLVEKLHGTNIEEDYQRDIFEAIFHIGGREARSMLEKEMDRNRNFSPSTVHVVKTYIQALSGDY